MVAARTPLEVVAFARRPCEVYGDVTGSLPRPQCVSTAFALRLHRRLFPLRCHRPHRAVTVITVFPRRSDGILRRLQGAGAAFPVCCEQTLEKGINRDS